MPKLKFRWRECRECDGTGFEVIGNDYHNVGALPCIACSGTGQVAKVTRVKEAQGGTKS